MTSHIAHRKLLSAHMLDVRGLGLKPKSQCAEACVANCPFAILPLLNPDAATGTPTVRVSYKRN